MSTAGHIRAAVRARNRELAREALLEAGLGVVFCMVIFGGVFWIAWLAMMFFFTGLGYYAFTYFTMHRFTEGWKRIPPL